MSKTIISMNIQKPITTNLHTNAELPLSMHKHSQLNLSISVLDIYGISISHVNMSNGEQYCRADQQPMP